MTSETLKNLFICICVVVLAECVSEHLVCACFLQRQCGCTPGTRATVQPVPPEEQPVLFTDEPSLQPLHLVFKWLHPAFLCGCQGSELRSAQQAFHWWICLLAPLPDSTREGY